MRHTRYPDIRKLRRAFPITERCAYLLPDASRFELGGADFTGQVGLLAAAGPPLDVGIEAIERWTLHLAELLIQDLERLGCRIASNLAPGRRSAIVSSRVPGDVDRVHEQLAAADIVISKREDLMRVSPHCYNTEDEILRVGEALHHAHKV